VPFAAGRAGAQEADPSEEGFDPATGSTRDFGFLPPRPASEKHIRPIMFPVLPDATLGKASWSDTYLAPRSGGRKHEGQDLMGNKMLKLLAVCDGTVIELRHQSGGNSLYLKGDDGWYYCYLHINNDDPGTDNAANQFKFAFAPGLAIGKRVLKGELVAYLGDSGNAEATGAHLHFEIRMPNAKWYNAAAVNAAYSLTAAEPAKLRAKVAASAFTPHSGAGTFAAAQATNFLGGIPSNAWFQKAVEDLEGGAVSLDAFIEAILDQPGAAGVTAPTIRLYLGYFLRMPDYSGLDYWIRKVRAGTSLDVAASQFAGGSEFLRRYGELDNAAYLTQIYRNLFGRDPDPSGMDYWKRRLDAGMKRGTLMRSFCESSEYKRKTASQVRVLQVHAGMLKRMPSASEYQRWTDWDAALGDKGLIDLIKVLRTSSEYAALNR
jgi:murein DD-endopeptidase MepM/ murein hydrolase activator NlpD